MVWSVSIDGTARNVLGLSFQTGSARSSNPQRPTGQWGTGRLSIQGYRTQTRKRLKISVGGTERVDAWIQNERFDDQTGISTYDVVGLLSVAARAKSMIAQGSANADANQTAVINKMRDAFGVSSIQSSLPSTPLSLYSFEGPAGGYASRFGLVAGGLPYATQNGLLGIKDPTRVPNTLNGTFGSRTHRIRDIQSDFDSNQLWNVLSTQYPSVIDGMSTPTLSRNSTVYADGMLRPSASASGDDVLEIGSQTSGSNHNYPAAFSSPAPTNANHRIVSGRFRLRPAGWWRTSGSGSGSLTILRTSISSFANLTQQAESGIWDQYVIGTVQANGSLAASITDRPARPIGDQTSRWWGGSESSFSNGEFTNVFYRVVSEYRLEIPDSQPIMVGNDASITAWDTRTLEVPGWIRSTATTTLQARINALAGVRNLRTVDFYLDQRDTTKTNAVAAIEPGHYIALSDVGTIVYVMNVEWRLSSRQSAIKRLTCIDTGTDHTPTVPTDALTWRSDEVTWRTQYLEWSRA